LLSVGSQQSVALVHDAPEQQASPVAPHGEQVPLLQTTLVPWQGWVSPTHLSVCGSQQPLAQAWAPAQHALPVTPQAGASGGESFGASTGESTGASVGESTGESVAASAASESPLESWPPPPSLAPSFDGIVPSLEATSPPAALSEMVPSLPPASPLADSGTVPSFWAPPSSPGDCSKTLKSFEHAANTTVQQATTAARRIDFIASLSIRGIRAPRRGPCRRTTWATG
jgi:hypothetical protein